jgi:hypothetical protein
MVFFLSYPGYSSKQSELISHKIRVKRTHDDNLYIDRYLHTLSHYPVKNCNNKVDDILVNRSGRDVKF